MKHKFKFRIGDAVCLKDCTTKYQCKTLTIRYRRMKIEDMLMDGSIIEAVFKTYSEDGRSFFPEESLVSKIDCVKTAQCNECEEQFDKPQKAGDEWVCPYCYSVDWDDNEETENEN